MKYGRAKWVLDAFVLSARDAARRFAFGRGSAARCRGSWRPLVLQWRRGDRRRQEKILTDRAATLKPIFWFPQIHFHYATHLSNRSRRSRASSFSPAAGGPVTRIVLEHRRTAGRAAELKQQPGHDARRLTPSYAHESAHESSRTKIDGALTNALVRSHPLDVRPIAPPVARRPLALHFGNASKIVHAKLKTEERAQPFHSRIWQPSLQIFRAPGNPHRSPERPVRPVRPVRKAVRFKIDVTEELVWRRATRPSTEVVDLEHQEAAFDSFDRPAARSSQSHEVVNSSPSPERAAVMQITTLDPGLLDRLTDDVIRRVEQRVRIERQRRGL